MTSERLRKTGEIDEKRYAAFVAKNAKANMRARDRANTSNDRENGFYGKTDAECRTMAEDDGAFYRHTFATFAPA